MLKGFTHIFDFFSATGHGNSSQRTKPGRTRRTGLAGAFIGAVLFATACEMPFDLKDSHDGRLYIECVVSPDSTTFSINYAAPLNGRRKTYDAFVPSVLRLTSDGGLNLVLDGTQCTIDQPLSVAFPAPLAEGDRFTISAEGKEPVAGGGYSDNILKASGTTLVPYAPEITKVVTETERIDTSYLHKITLTLDREPGQHDFFGIRVVRINVTTEFTDTVIVKPGHMISEMALGSLDLDEMLSIGFEDNRIQGEMPLLLLTERQFDGRVYDFYVDAYDSEYYYDGNSYGMDYGWWWVHEGALPEIISSRYKVQLFRLSEEFYYSAKAQYMKSLDFLSNLGLTPPNFTYTNIDGGLGYIGAISLAETDWLRFE
ncbi:MAG: DUF4249 family protein [Bacteroidales bacterium]|nr:DUF4249 family protein [Candidatus Cryptobacteroides aphodequi]